MKKRMPKNSMIKPKKPLDWQLTPWLMNGLGGWKQQPVITAEAEVPFFADHPDKYIAKLQSMHDDPKYARGPFFTSIGQLKDGREQSWGKEEINGYN